MRKRILLFCSCALLLLQVPAMAQTLVKASADDLPPVILSGLQAYKDKGPDEAIRIWIKDGPLEGNRGALAQANNLREVQASYGAYQYFEVISEYDIGRRTRILYLTLDFESGPLFAKFVVYQSNHRWIVISFDFNTKEEMILPQLP